MSILCWNCRGLGRPKAVPSLKDLIRVYKPDIFFLIETLSHSNKIRDVCYLLGYDFYFTVDREGRSGGLAVIWKSSFQCSIINYSSNFINMQVQDAARGNWRLTSFWGYSDTSRRRQSWNLLRELASMSNDPWCIIGDFNDLLTSDDKRGGAERPSWLYNGFRSAVNDCNLHDLPLEGYQFTWFKSLGTPRAVEERLDRVLHSSSWISLFPSARLLNLVAATSDHSPILLKLEQENYIHPKRSFRFENSWLLDQSLADMVDENWHYYPANNILQKLKYCVDDMEAWSKTNTPNFCSAANKLRRELDAIRCGNDHRSDASITNIQNKLSCVLLQEDRYWKQRSKVFWLKDGDKNNKFFHASASARRKRNTIKRLRDTNNNIVEDQAGLCSIAQNYFHNLYSPIDGDHSPIIAAIPQCISPNDNIALTSPFSEEEFRQAAFSMHPDKSPGPDGLNPGFFQKFWPLIGREIFEASCSWLEEGSFPPNLNDTNIALIAKVDRPENMKDLRPISLCNVIYKILSKVLANRLKRILHKCISDSQAAFVPGRDILDNALTAFEVLHSMKCKTRGKVGNIALKLDVSKAFDRVKWSYLHAVMEKMGFSNIWVNWIMQCVSSVSYHVLLNNDRVGPINPLCGLRQGDPLSPYLYIICSEGLSSYIRHHESRGLLHGTRICRGSPSITHLLFADDSFLFCKATISEVTTLKHILDTYEAASGQAINYQKSSIAFSRNTDITCRNNIIHLLGVVESMGQGRYLGLPSMVGRDKKSIFSFIK